MDERDLDALVEYLTEREKACRDAAAKEDIIDFAVAHDQCADEYAQWRTAIAALRARAEQAEADSARMDYMERHRVEVCDTDENGQPYNTLLISDRHRSLRGQIDTIRARSQGGDDADR